MGSGGNYQTKLEDENCNHSVNCHLGPHNNNNDLYVPDCLTNPLLGHHNNAMRQEGRHGAAFLPGRQNPDMEEDDCPLLLGHR
jgi:hypothetical protein